MRQVQRWGNNVGIRIPKALAIVAGLEEGSEIDLDIENSHFAMKSRTDTLEYLLSNIMPDNLYSEVQTGEPQGWESW